MKKIILFIFCLSTIQFANGQASEALNQNNQNLKERFSLMKAKSQTYQDYKVIKEVVLDGVWKIVQDSIKAKETVLHNMKADIKRLKEEVNQINLKLKEKEQSMADVDYASTHINALGISFQKKSFLALVIVMVCVLLLMLGLIIGRLKLIHFSMKEKTDSLDIISKEYEEYKRKALDKQSKLSRELQDERNKMHR